MKKKTLWMGGGASLRLQSWGKPQVCSLAHLARDRPVTAGLSFTCHLLKYLKRLIKVRMVDELSP